MRQEHLKKLEEMAAISTQTKCLLQEREKEATDLRASLIDMEKKKDEMETNLRQEICKVNDRSETEKRELGDELATLKQAHNNRIMDMETEHKRSLDELSSTLTSQQDMAGEVRRWQDKCADIECDFATKESSLNNRLSKLAGELSQTKDQLALVEQRERELERKLSGKSKAEDGVSSLLETRTMEAKELREQLCQQKDAMTVLMDRYKQQKEEINKMAGMQAG